MATTASGPTMAGGMQPIVKDGYELLYFPDVHNDALQRERKAPVFYYLPNYVHIARKNGADDGDFMFNLIRFSGVQTSETTVGVEGKREVAGGVLTFTVNSAPPDHVLEESQKQIIAQYNASNDFFWGIRTNVQPIFRPAPIVSNVTTVSNVSPIANDGGTPAAAPRSTRDGSTIVRAFPVPPPMRLPRTVPATRDNNVDSNLNPWYWNLQGQGNGSIDPMGQNAYSALLGAYPTAILWQGFHGAYSPVVVMQNLMVKMWAPMVEIKIHGQWNRIFDHFSGAASGRYLWASADIKAEFNNMRMNGDIEVEVLIDPTIPGAGDIQSRVDQKTNLVYEKFMAEAKRIIFEPPQPQVEPAQASSGGIFGWGAGLSLKYRRDETNLELNYHEKQEMAFLQPTTISSSLEGMFEAMKNDPKSEKLYFQTVYLEDFFHKLGRVIKPVVNWPKPEQNWAGQPVAFVSAQVGYPNANGEIMWTGHTFQKSDGPDATWNIGITQKVESDVVNPPQDWKPDKTFIKRKIHLMEPPDEIENPFVRVQIDKNIIELDPEPNGTLLNDITIETRADSASRLALGPLTLGVELESTKQTIEVTFEPTNDQGQPINRSPVRFVWNFNDQFEPRFWSIFTDDSNFRAFYRYKARVIVKGSLFTKGMEWEGPWVDASGNGPLTVTIPTPEDPGVVTRALPDFSAIAALPDGNGAPPAARENGYPQRATEKVRDLEISGWSLSEHGSRYYAGQEAPPAQSGYAGAPLAEDDGFGFPPDDGSQTFSADEKRDDTVLPSQLEVVGWRVEE